MPDVTIDLQKLQEAKAATETAFKKLQETMGDTGDLQTMVNQVVDYMGSLHNQLGYLTDTVYNHTSNGHLPPIKSREHMAKAIKNLGIGEEYEVAPKKVVYANTKHGIRAIIGKDVEI